MSTEGRAKFATSRVWIWWALIPISFVPLPLVGVLAYNTAWVTILSLTALALSDAAVRAGIRSEKASEKD